MSQAHKTPSVLKLLRTGAVAGVLAVGAATGFAAIVSVMPAVVLFTPADVRLGQTESDVQIDAFDEQQCVKVNLQTDQGWISSEHPVSCHFLHLDPVTSGLLDGRARFDNDIVGVISSSALLDASDGPCGLAGVTYPAAGAEPFRGLEAFQPDDRYQIIGGGRVIRVQMDVPSYSDQIRVLTKCGD
jgi:hypothetical protein